MLPAYAGMIPSRATTTATPVRAPRVCGDDPGLPQELESHPLVLPAYAGMIRPGTGPRIPLQGAPRVCGDDPLGHAVVGDGDECSPRMRG